jgi:hypothetical protein
MSRNRAGRSRRYNGRYSYLYSLWWSDRRVKTLEPEELRLLLCLSTGRLSNQSGIFLLSVDSILQDFQTGRQPITREDVQRHLGALRNKPRAADAFVDFDETVIWIRHRLQDDPAKLSRDSLKGIMYELSRLPRSSRVVRRFYRYYEDLLGQAPLQAPTPGPPVGPPAGTRDRDRDRNRERNRDREPRLTPAENHAAGASQPNPEEFSLSSSGSEGTAGRTSSEGRIDDGAIAMVAKAIAIRNGNGAKPEAYVGDAVKLLKEERKYCSGNWSAVASVLLKRLATDSRP